MTYIVKAIFEDGTSKVVKYSYNYDDAIRHLLFLTDQRKTYASLLPLLKNVQLIAGNSIEFDMLTEWREIRPLAQEAASEDLASDDCSVNLSDSKRSSDQSELPDTLQSNIIRLSSYRCPLNGLDMLTRWEPSHFYEAGFYSGLDNPSHTIRVMGSGIWREQHAALYFEQQKKIVDRARHRFGPLKILFDVRNWVVENPQSALQFQNVNQELYHPDDRLVAVVKSVSDKEHPRTALRGKNTEVFTSLTDAETWLQCGGGHA